MHDDTTGVTRYQLERAKSGYTIILIFTADYWDGLKINLNASKPSEHSPDRGNISSQGRCSSCHLMGFSDSSRIGSTV